MVPIRVGEKMVHGLAKIVPLSTHKKEQSAQVLQYKVPTFARETQETEN